MSEKRKRVVLDFFQKLDIIKRLQCGEKAMQIAASYGIGRTTVADIKRDADKIANHVLEMEQNDCVFKYRKNKSMKVSKYKQVNIRVFKWCLQQRDNGIPLSGPAIAQAAIDINKEIGGDPKFRASVGWLDRFKTRYGIKLHHLKEESLSDTETSKYLL